jgi:hypothetical protein
MMNERLDFIARAALGIGIGASLAALLAVTNSALAATVGLGDSDLIAVKLSMLAVVVWFCCRSLRAR